ncbi:MAG TPA: amidohydrolase family protein, partial [Rubrivivax sp.]|nr:amidohydrolase family protein [Rubrivivax sp.]
MHAASDELVIRGARVWAGQGAAQRADVLVRDGRIAQLGMALQAAPDAAAIEAPGALVLPGLADAHAHFELRSCSKPWCPSAHLYTRRGVLPDGPPNEPRHAERALAQRIARGATHIRAHVEVGPEQGLAALHRALAARESLRDAVELQVAAVARGGAAGLTDSAAMLDLLDQAAQQGAAVIGAVDATPPGADGVAPLDALFAIASRRGCRLDFALRDGGAADVVRIERIIERTRALGLAGRVSIGHASVLGLLAPQRLDTIAARLAEQRITLMTLAPGGGTPQPPLRRLVELGVPVVTGSDGAPDEPAMPGPGDMLERAYLVAYVNGLRRDADLQLALHMASIAGARLIGGAEHGIRVGCAADLVIVDAASAAEAVLCRPPRRWVIKRARV